MSRTFNQDFDFKSLRVIPWIFAWTQTRYNLPGWYGIGEALLSVIQESPNNLYLLQQMYKQWPFFYAVIENAQLEMARAKLNIAYHYNELYEKSFHAKIVEDFEKAQKAILLITQQKELLDKSPVIKKSIQLRNPYTDVLNLLQIELLKRTRHLTEKDAEDYHQILFLSINSIAAAMQSTG